MHTSTSRRGSSPLRFLLLPFLLGGLCLCNGPASKARATEPAPPSTRREYAGQVWQVGSHRWDEAEERLFAVWVEQNVTENFLLRHRVAVDCADVPYAIRWIYARMRHLPAAATLGDGRLFGHWSTALAHLPTHPDWSRDARFRAALDRVLGGTTTKTLPADTYPIRIAPDSVLAGAAFFAPEAHSGLIGRVVQDGGTVHPLQTWEATLPRKARKLLERNFFFTCPDPDERSGLVRFRWPVSDAAGRWGYLPEKEHPYYSEEQYGFSFCGGDDYFDEAVARRLDPVVRDPRERAEKLISTIFRRLSERIPVVLDGYRHCGRGGCPEGSPLWEVYSTPGRDGMLTFLVQHLEKQVEAGRLDREALKARMEQFTLRVGDDLGVSLAFVVDNHLWLSSNPGDSIAARWGLEKCAMIRARMASSLQALDFVEEKYRATDPGYADYGRNLHLSNLRELALEGIRSGCEGLPAIPP